MSLRGLVGLSMIGGLVGSCSCGMAHEPDAAFQEDGAIDGGVDAPADAGSDVYVVLMDIGICSPREPLCNTDADCLAWGDSVAPPGTYVSSRCVDLHCTLGVAHCWVFDGMTRCRCAESLECPSGQVCVSDTPGGPTRCTEACVGR